MNFDYSTIRNKKRKISIGVLENPILNNNNNDNFDTNKFQRFINIKKQKNINRNTNSNTNTNTNTNNINNINNINNQTKIELLILENFEKINMKMDISFKTFSDELASIKKLVNKDKIYKEIENTNKKIQCIENSIFQLTKELNDLQVHALHGNFELNKSKIKNMEEENSMNHIYY